MTTPLTFGGWVKWRRRGLGLTQKELAHQVGYAVVTLRKVEADELRPSGQMAKQLAAALQLEPQAQAQFVRFARDQAHWDDIKLPDRVAAPPIPQVHLPQETTPSLDGLPDQARMPAVARQSLSPQWTWPALGEMDETYGGRFDRPRPRHNLPAQTAPLLGREHELAELAYLLADPVTKLITILAAGGMGKTHLAIAAALQQVDHFAHGICWVPLAPLTDVKELVLAIATALGLQLQGERTPEQQVGDFLQAKQLLLVLDNFEHLLEGASFVGELLARAPQLSILITSRQRLKLSSETVILLDGLSFPSEQTATAMEYPAVQLFLLHARRALPAYQPDASDVAGIAEVCRLVQGMPLGILLAAAWTGVIPPAQIAAEIGGDLGFLQTDMPDVPARQRNLRAVFLHTWDRLSAAERDVFMRLSVFRGGATAEAAQQVTGASIRVLAGLIDKALLWRLPNGRYAIHELLRQFAAEQLAMVANTHSEAQEQHGRYYLELLAQHEQQLQVQTQSAAVAAIRADFENINVAWHWTLQQRQFALLLPAVHPLFLYSEVGGKPRDCMLLFADASAVLGASAGERAATPVFAVQPLWGQVLVRLGACEVMANNYQRGEQLIEEGLQFTTQERERAFALAYLGLAAVERGDLALSRLRLHDSLAISRQGNDAAGMAYALLYLLRAEADYAECCRVCSQSLALACKTGRPDLIADQLIYLGFFHSCLGNYAAANVCWQEALALCAQLELRNDKAAWALDCIGFAAWCQGNLEEAESRLQEALAVYANLGRPVGISMCMAELALVLADKGEVEQAVTYARQAVAMTREVNAQMMLTIYLNYLAATLLPAGSIVEARHTLIEAIQRGWSGQYLHFVMVTFYYFAQLLVLEIQDADPASASERMSLATALLSCVRNHKAAWQVYRDKAAALQAEIESKIPVEMFTAAIQMGTRQTVAALVSSVLGEQPTALVGEPAPIRTLLPERNLMPAAQLKEILVEPLTDRELEILHLLSAGYTNQKIADALTVVVGTVKAHNHRIFGKLGASNRVQALARARELGLLT